MTQNTQMLLNAIKKVLKDVRFGNLSSRLKDDNCTGNKELVNDFNNMLESIQDREIVLKEYQHFYNTNAEYLKKLFNMLNDGGMALSEDLTILFVNDIQVKWMRKSKKNLSGKSLENILQLYTITDYSTNKILTDFKDFFKKERKNVLLSFEIKKIKLFFSVSVKKFHNLKGELNYFVISKDVSNDINLQKLKNTFVATLTHDLKVPILAESKVLQLLQNETFGKNSDAQSEAIKNMQMNNSEMMRLVSTLLDVYKIEEGVFEIHKAEFDLTELLNEIAVKLKFLLSDNNLKLKIICTKKIRLIADKNQITRVLNNIITNACNYAPENSDVIVDVSQKNNNVCISVTDFGSGIDKEHLPHIFDRYYTSDKKYRKVGTGLGLYLSKKITELHDGDVTVESVPNKKTTFYINLPVK